MPNIRLMQGFGHFFFKFVSGPILIRKIYASVTFLLLLLQFFSILINMAQNSGEVNELTANTITALFFTHCITKCIYFGLNNKAFVK